MTLPAEINGLPVVSATVEMPYVGVWHVSSLEASGSTAPEVGSVQTLSINGVQFSCAVTRATAIAGRVKMRLAGGKGRLVREIAARHWSMPTVGAIIRAILAECGETLAPVASTAATAVNGATIDPTILSVKLPQWKTNAIQASRAMQRVCDHQGLIWRVLRDGTVWIGTEAYPEQTVKHTLIDEDWASGAIDFAPDAPDLKPGVTFRGQQIRYVVHTLTRSEACLETPSGLLDRFLSGIRQEIQFSRSYPAEVIAQNADGTLQLRPIDTTIKGGGLNNVPIRTGLPGFEVRVPKGAIVSLEFNNGDPSDPRASLWTQKTGVTSLAFGDGVRGFARVGDQVQVVAPPAMPITGTLGGAPFVGVLTIATPFYGIIQTGRGEFMG